MSAWNDALVDRDRRQPVVTSLIDLAASDDYKGRADAGRALAVFAEAAQARETLLRLVLDRGDTFVTLTTAEALLRRQDAVGLAIVAEALASADAQQSSYVQEAVSAVFTMFASERDHALEACDALSQDAGDAVRQGAGELREMLAQIHPVLYPQDPAG